MHTGQYVPTSVATIQENQYHDIHTFVTFYHDNITIIVDQYRDRKNSVLYRIANLYYHNILYIAIIVATLVPTQQPLVTCRKTINTQYITHNYVYTYVHTDVLLTYVYISSSISPSGGLMIPCLMSSSLSRLRDNLRSRSAVEHTGMSKAQWTRVPYITYISTYTLHTYIRMSTYTLYIHIMDESQVIEYNIYIRRFTM